MEVIAGKPYGAAPLTNDAGEVVATPMVDPTIRTGLVLAGIAVLALYGLYKLATPVERERATGRESTTSRLRPASGSLFYWRQFCATVLQPGDPAPDFGLEGTDGTRVGRYRLSAAARETPVVVATVTGDDGRSRGFLDTLGETDWTVARDGVAVFGLVPADTGTCRRLVAALDLPYPLLSADRNVLAQFGVDGTGGLAAFLVNRQCRIERVVTPPAPDEPPAVEPLRQSLRSP